MRKNVILLPCVVFAETLGTVKFDSHATDCPRQHEIAFCSLVDRGHKNNTFGRVGMFPVCCHREDLSYLLWLS